MNERTSSRPGNGPPGNGEWTGALARCARCALHLRLCLCASLQPLDLCTRVVVISQHREVRKPTNSGRLVPLTLLHGEVRVFERAGAAAQVADLALPTRRTVLLYPTDGSRPLERAVDDERPLTLIVPDGTWRQTRKIARALERSGLPGVHLPRGAPSRYRLRSHPDLRFLATFEAVARALGILEGPSVQARLEHVFALMVERTLWSRGRLAGRLVTGGIPSPLRARATP